MVANLIGLGTPSLSSPITGPVRTPSASRLIGPTLMKQAKQVFYCGERNPLRQERKRGRSLESVCLRDNERESKAGWVCECICVYEVGWGVCV